MTKTFDYLLPEEIEKRSFEIITKELGNIRLDEDKAGIIKRVIHTTADFGGKERPGLQHVWKKKYKFDNVKTCQGLTCRKLRGFGMLVRI